MEGKLIIISAPSGAGKTTIVKEILKKDLPLAFSISVCSRDKRENEVDGKDYYFMGKEVFEKKIAKDEFLEWEEVYQGSYYGTLKSELNRIWDENKHVLFDVDVVGGLNIKKQFPKNSLSIFIQPPSIQELENRLLNRGTETEKTLAKRIQKAEKELEFAQNFDVIVVNQELETAIEEVFTHIINFIENEKA